MSLDFQTVIERNKREIRFCHDETRIAIEYYLNNVVFKKPVVVSKVSENKNANIFEVQIFDAENKENAE